MNAKSEFVPVKREVVEQVVDAAFSTYCSQHLGKLVPALRAALEQPGVEPEVHDAKCPALTGDDCKCSERPTFTDKPWARFCGAIGRGPNAPYPGMIEAFESHYSQSFTDRDWRNEAGVWAAAWKAAKAQTAPQPAPQPDTRATAIQACIDRLIFGGKPAAAQMLRHHFAKDLGAT